MTNRTKVLLVLIVVVVAIIGIIVMKKIEPNDNVNTAYSMYVGVILMLYLLVITKGE